MYAPGAPSGDNSLTGGEFLSIVVLCLTSKRSSICAPFRLIEPSSEGVWICTRGVEPRTFARLCNALGVEGAGWACGWGRATCLPSSTFVLCGFAVGKKVFAA